MDIRKKFYEEIIKKSFTIPLKVIFWDGEKVVMGDKPENTIRFMEPLNWKGLARDATLTLAEAYMDKKIEVEGSIQELMVSAFSNKESFIENPKYKFFKYIQGHDKKKSKEDISYHYDLGNDFYKHWLDDSMTYSCAYFEGEKQALEEAQEAKIRHILKKLRLKKGDRLLDIGCGWGELIIEASKSHKVKSLGITLSQEQYDEVKEKVYRQGLEELVQVKIMDYRDLAQSGEKFSKIVSVGMFEHVGKENVGQYAENINEMMEGDSLALIHGISGQRDPYDGSKGKNTFLNKYIFPGGYIPSVSELIYAFNKTGLKLIDMESMRRQYQLTLEEWWRRFRSCWQGLEEEKGERFMRMWDIYLQGCAAIFQAGQLDVCQYLLEKGTDNTRPLTRSYMV